MYWRGDKPSRTQRLCLAATVAALLPPATLSAEIVRLTSGRSLTVESSRIDGASVVLSMPDGREIRIAREIVQELVPSEPARGKDAALLALARSSAPDRQMDRSAIRRLVDQVAARVGLDRKLAHAVVHTESNYEPLAISPRGAIGLMQIMPALVRHYGLEDPFDPMHNLEAGMRHLHRLLERFDIRRALAAYNAGEGAVARYGGVPPFRETEDYVRRILEALR